MTDGIVQLGPIALAVDRLLAVALMLAFLFAMDRIAVRSGRTDAKALGATLLVGIVAARAAYVAKHWTAFSYDYLDTIAIWQGGFVAWAGFVAAALFLGWRLRKGRALILAEAALALCALVWFASAAALKPAPYPMPDLPALTTLEGEPFDTASLKGRPYVVNVWAIWCAPCRRELPMLTDEAARSDIPVLLANQREDAESIMLYFDDAGFLPSGVVLDEEGVLGRDLGNGTIPTTVFVDASGKKVTTYVGEISRAGFREEVAGISE